MAFTPSLTDSSQGHEVSFATATALESVILVRAASGSLLSSSISATATMQDTTESSDGGEGDGSPISRSSSLLFGFLVTLLALFIGFMACGYTSRRSATLSRIRGRGVAPAEREEPCTADCRKRERPVLWDVYLNTSDTSQNLRWEEFSPLSATLSTKRPKTPRKPPDNVRHAPRRNYEDRSWWSTYVMPGATGRARFYASSVPRSVLDGGNRATEQVNSSTQDPPTTTISFMLRDIRTRLSAFAMQGVYYTRSHLFASRISPSASPLAPTPQVAEVEGSAAISSESKDDLENISHIAMSGRRAQIAVIVAMPCPYRHAHPISSAKLKNCASSDNEPFSADQPLVCEIGIVTTRISSQAKTPVTVEGD